MQEARPAAFGIACALGASVCFSLNDVTIKLLSGDYPLHQIVFARAVIALTLTLAIIMPLEGGLRNLRTRRPGMHLLRGMFVVTANTSFFAGIAVMPLADVTAIFFMAPLFITGFSMIFLGEAVGPRRWAAIGIGLLGVLLIVRPGGGSFTAMAVLPAVAAVAYAGLQTMTRSMGLKEKASTMAFFIQVTFILVTGTLGVLLGDGRYLPLAGDNGALQFFLRPWVMPPASDFVSMGLLGVFSAAGGYLISQAYRGTQAALVAPFEYTALIMSVVWGITLWAEVPVATTWVGIALIAGSGIFVALREAQTGTRVPSAKRIGARR